MKIAVILAALGATAVATPTERLKERQTTSSDLPIVTVKGNGTL